MLAIAEQVESGEAVLVHDDGFAVDDARSDRQAGDGVYNQRVTIGEVAPIARDEFNSVTVFPREDTKAVVLDLMYPGETAGRRFS
jgi:hypothetical protein